MIAQKISDQLRLKISMIRYSCQPRYILPSIKIKPGQCAWLKRLNNDFTITHGTQTDCFIKLLTKPSGEIDSTNLFTKEYVKWKIKSLKNNECNLKLIQRLENSFRQGRQQISKQNF